MTGFLGDISENPDRSHVVSHGEMALREGYSPSKGMNIRSDGRPSLFLMSVAAHPQYWDSASGVMIYDGHDATNAGKNRKKIDQPMYKEEGILSDNGRFFKAAESFKAGSREVLEIQVYEWLDSGVWFDKGLFLLVGAQYLEEGGRNVFKFHLKPVGDLATPYGIERMIPLQEKLDAWRESRGACAICGTGLALRFVRTAAGARFACFRHYN